VRIEFHPKLIGYREILEVFFAVHDPTTLNRQGADVGEQYRSVIFHHSEAQKNVANDVIREAQQHYDDEIVTQLLPAGGYWRAETYHQEYFRNNPAQGYCMMVVAPKVEKFRRTFAARRRPRGG
jgi:peptide-methionine (S)-S-oxide reductase